MKEILCKIMGHQYRLLRKITPTIAELKCSRCKKEFGINTDVKKVLPLDWELKQLHKELSH